MLEMRTSERSSLKRCAQQWYWSTVEGLAPIRAANPLWFGSAVHEGLAAWYLPGFKRGPHPAETFDASLAGDRSFLVTNEEEEQEYTDARELGLDMLSRYVKQWGQDERWDVIATEKTFQVVFSRPAIELFGIPTPEVKRWLRYVGTWDGVYRDRDTGEIWLMEHKTAASIRVDHLSLDDQAGSYWAIANIMLRKAGILKPKESIAGIMYNFLRKALGDSRPFTYAANGAKQYMNKPTKKEHYVSAITAHHGNHGPGLNGKETIAQLSDIAVNLGIEVYGDVSASQPPEYFQRWPVYRSVGERKTMIRRIQDEAIFAEAYRNGWLPVTKSPGKDTCTYCPFNRMCQLDESGDQDAVEELKESLYLIRNPYENHVRKSA